MRIYQPQGHFHKIMVPPWIIVLCLQTLHLSVLAIQLKIWTQLLTLQSWWIQASVFFQISSQISTMFLFLLSSSRAVNLSKRSLVAHPPRSGSTMRSKASNKEDFPAPVRPTTPGRFEGVFTSTPASHSLHSFAFMIYSKLSEIITKSSSQKASLCQGAQAFASVGAESYAFQNQW